MVQFRAHFAAVLTAFVGIAAAQPSPSQDLKVLYTGRLLGYARTPDLERLRPRNAGGAPIYDIESAATSSPFATALEAQLANRDANTLTLGLGDNFGPDFYSRSVLLLDSASGPRYVPKDELLYDTVDHGWRYRRDLATAPAALRDRLTKSIASGTAIIDADNVAAFFTKANFDALVPGRDDFHYGPERLRQLARLLASGTHPVQLLGANLTIQSHFARAPQTTNATNYQRLLPHGMDFVIPRTTLPWIRRFRIQHGLGAAAKVTAAKLCLAPHRETLDYANCEDLRVEAVTTQRSESFDDPPGADDAVLRLADHHPLLLAEHTYLLCADVEGETYCRAVDIASPFFQYPVAGAAGYQGNRATAAIASNAATPKPYVHKAGAVVMGVVAAGFEQGPGFLNTSWWNADDNVDTSVATSDPAEALLQLLDYCADQGDCSPGTRYILLAQMPAPTATLLNRRLRDRFNLVLAETDANFATLPGLAYPSGHALTVVPEPVYRTSHLEVMVGGVEFTPTGKHTFRETAGETIRLNGPLRACLAPAIQKRFDALVTARPQPELAQQFTTVILDAMRRRGKAEVALIQKRDLYHIRTAIQNCVDDPAAPDAEVEALERTIWKGDLAVTMTITGAALKAILAQGAEFDRQDGDPYTQHSDPNRGLLTLGLVPSPDRRSWYVNGSEIEDQRLYSVAMTDFLAFGDTGYAAMRTPAVPPPYRPRNIGNPERLLDVVAEALPLRTPFTRAALPLSAYLDHSFHLPFAIGPAATLKDKIATVVSVAQGPKWKDHTIDALGQEQTFWRIFVDRGELSFTRYQTNYPTFDQLRGSLAGIPDSGIITPQRRSWANALYLEARRESPRATFYNRFEEEYARDFVQQRGAAGIYLLSYGANRFSVENGWRIALAPTARRVPYWSWILASNLTTQVADPLDTEAVAYKTGICPITDPNVAATQPPCATVLFQSHLSRTNRLFAKTGLRYQTKLSWMEAGLLGGATIRATSYSVRLHGQPINGAANCDPSAIGACLAGASVPPGTQGSDLQIAAHLKGRADSGMFLNFSYLVPLPKNPALVALTFDNQGLMFFNTREDISVDARLIERFSAGLRVGVPRLPALSVKPTYGLLFYQNRVYGNLLFGRTFDVRLEYRFDWQTGVSWRRALAYGRPR